MSNGAIESIGRADGGPGGLGRDDRIVAATLDCLSRWGLAKTTAEDIARTAGVSRATLYRQYPGGMSSLIEEVSRWRINAILTDVAAALEASSSLEEALADGLAVAGTLLVSDEALQYLIRHEPEVLMPYFAFDRIGPALVYTTSVLAPLLERYVRPQVSEELVEWGFRLLISLTFTPGSIDPTDSEEIGEVVSQFLLPGFSAEELCSTL